MKTSVMNTIKKIALVIFMLGVSCAFAKRATAQGLSNHSISYSKIDKEIAAALKGINQKSIVWEKRYKRKTVDFFQLDPARSKFQIAVKNVGAGLC